MMTSTMLAVMSSLVLAAGGTNLQVRVDHRTELMSIVFRLAGASEYCQPQSYSPYGKEVDQYFAPFKNHPAVQMAGQLRADRGISYNAPMSLAQHLKDTTSFAELVPLDPRPARLDDRWRPVEAREFVGKLKDFARISKFNEFAAKHDDLYKQTEKRMKEFVAGRDYVKWFDSYFGARAKAEFVIVVNLINGPANYGSSVEFPDGAEIISPVIGADSFDDEGIPFFKDYISGLIVHEFCHSYTNPLVRKYAKQLEPPASRMFKYCGREMTSQHYGSWEGLMNESFVRSVVVRHCLSTDGLKAARKQADNDHGRGFIWIWEMAEVLGEYEKNREKYADFEAFMPRIVKFFDEYSVKYEAQAKLTAAKAPIVVSMTPANGAKDVDPDTKAIVVVFDKPMMDKSWAVVGGGPDFPEIAGELSYDIACKVLTIPVKLKPDWSYKFWLNYGQYTSFRSQDGGILEPVAVTFETGS